MLYTSCCVLHTPCACTCDNLLASQDVFIRSYIHLMSTTQLDRSRSPTMPCIYGTPFWTKIRSHGAILSPVDLPRSSTYVPRSPIAVTRPSIHFPRTLHVPRSQIAVTRPSIEPSTFLDPRSSALDPTYLHPVLQIGFHCAFPLEHFD